MPMLSAIPDDQHLTLRTERLTLEPILASHAEEMASVLGNPALYSFIPAQPPTVESLRSRYLKWQSGCSPDHGELWLNWVAREYSTLTAIGHFQAGLHRRDRHADIAYIVGVQFQGKGYALEALSAILHFLKTVLHAKSVKALIDTRNTASIRLATKLGMRKVRCIKNADHFKGSDSDEYHFALTFETGE